MLELLTIIAGATVGFVGARVLRRPVNTATAASVARSVGGAVGTRRDLDLARLQRSVFSEMMRHVATRGGAAAIVPASYRVRLHPEDHATVDQAPGFFTQGLEQAMTTAGRQRGWTVPARLRIELVPDPNRRRGAPAVDAAAPLAGASPSNQPTRAGGPASPSPVSPSPARLERRGDGETYELVDPTTIGRGTDRTIRVDDSRASRVHARVRRDGASWTLTDEGSSNGTRLGGQTIQTGTPRVLRDGDEIGVGPVTFVFRIGAGAPPTTSERGDADERTYAQRVLDEQQRRNISQEFFPVDDPARRDQ